MLSKYYTDNRDQVLLAQTPTLMQPRFGKLPPPELNKHRFILGDDGLYIEVRSSALECRLQISESKIPLPYGKVESGFRLVHGEIPSSIYDTVTNCVKAACPTEWTGLIVWNRRDNCYQLFEPDVLTSSSSHISYVRALDEHLELVVDIHSHGADTGAYFSSTDNDSEDGTYIAEVYGNCDKQMSLASRFVINGIAID
jgi:PRTRC genetic system protein A